MLELSRTVELPDDFGTDVISIKAGQPVELEVRLESVVEGVLVTGSVSGTATGACVRCLDPVELDVDGRFQELFAYADRAAHHHEVGADTDEDEVHELVGDLIDLEPVLRDAVVPTLPFQPVCRADCPGLCSECGMHLADDPDHHHEVIRPPMVGPQRTAGRRPAREEELTWLSRSGRCRAPTPVRVARTGRQRRPR